MSQAPAHLARVAPLLLLAPLALIGCVSDPQTSAISEPAVVPASAPETTAVRSARYTLVEIAPAEAQRNLMHQVIDVTAPQGLPTSVADMLRYVLLRSGYSACEGEALARFETFPLPAAHLHLGPIALRDALEVLAGPAWQLAVDDASRQVCFVPADRNQAFASGATP
jgi:conjugative transfer region protein (TIGR03748 family)